VAYFEFADDVLEEVELFVRGGGPERAAAIAASPQLVALVFLLLPTCGRPCGVASPLMVR
jgi:hypothetical protein